jgi:hypothetical protein
VQIGKLGQLARVAFAVLTVGCSGGGEETAALGVAAQAIDLPTFVKQAYIKGSNNEALDSALALAVSADGNTLAVGARGEDSASTGINQNQTSNSAASSGAVYVYTRSSGAWTQQAYIKASNTGANDEFGIDVSLSADGNTLAVGAFGEDSNGVGVNSNSQANNSSVDSGAAYVFTRSSGTWSQQAYIKASNAGAGDGFGGYVVLSSNGNTLAVSADGEDSSATAVGGSQVSNGAIDSGAAYVFTRSSGAWSQQAYIKATNTDADDYFGSGLALSADGNTLAAGAFEESSAATTINGSQTDNSLASAGAAYVYTRSGGAWSAQAYIKPSSPGEDDQFGLTLSLSSDGNLLAVGAPYEDGSATGSNNPVDELASDSGAVFLFARASGAWSQQAYIKASNTGENDEFGSVVALSSDGSTLAASSFWEGSSSPGVNGNQFDDSIPGAGAVFTFTKTNGVFVQRNYVKASNPDAQDGFGISLALSSDGTTLAVLALWEDGGSVGINGNEEDDSATSASATYVYTSSVVPTFAHEAYLKASNTGAGDNFGFTTAMSADGNTLAVGAYREDSSSTGVNNSGSNDAAASSGAVYVFVRVGGAWSQQAYIKASNAEAGDYFGRTIALSGDGNTLAVAAQLEDSNAVGIGNSQTNNAAAESGAVYVFSRSGSTWSQQAYVKASNTGAGDEFGAAIALSTNGSTMAVGAPYEDSNGAGINGVQTNDLAVDSGAIYVFTRSGTTWTQQVYLKGASTGAGDGFGYTASLAGTGSLLLVGASYEDGSATLVGGNQADNGATDAGAAYVFSRSGSAWTQQAYLKASNTDAGDSFGDRVLLSSDGSTAVVGAWLEDSSATGVNGDQASNATSGAGAAYVYTQSGGIWTFQAYLKASNTDAADAFGASLGISSNGSVLAIGAPLEDSSAVTLDGNQTLNDSSSAGAVYLFARSGSAWSQQSYIKASNTAANDRFGIDMGVSLSSDGTRLAVSSYLEDSSATGVNGNQASNAAASSGAVYVLSR